MSTYYEEADSQEWDLYEGIALLIGKNPGSWQSIGAILGLVGGTLSPVLGTLLTAVTWLIDSHDELSFLNVLSIVSFVITIPLLAGGAHCLDLLERKTAEPSRQREEAPEKTAAINASDRAGLQNGRGLKVTGATSIAAVLLFTLPASGYSQQTILDVPSADVRQATTDDEAISGSHRAEHHGLRGM